MGKYMRKAKAATEVTILEVSQSLGVLTRAKTLALQGLKNSRASTKTSVESSASSASYLQLRNRQLVKVPIRASGHHVKRRKHNKRNRPPIDSCLRNPNNKAISNLRSGQNSRLSSISSSSGGLRKSCALEDVAEKLGAVKEEENNDVGIEASLGENFLDFEGRQSLRESTPCSLVRDPDSIKTPGSTTRPTSSNPRIDNPPRRVIPTAREIDEFFAGVEEKQQKLFIEKYNFDPVNDMPLPGRFEWEKTDH